MKKRSLINYLCLTGILGLLFYLLHDIIGGYFYPNYNWMSQAVSDLTSISSPSFIIARGLSTVYNLFTCLSCVLVCIVVQNKGNKLIRLGIYLFATMNWISGIGYSLFPLSESGFAGSFTDIMHLVVTIAVVLLSIVSLVLIIIGSFKQTGETRLGVLAIVALIAMFIGALGVNIFPARYFGLIERFGTYSAVIFNAILSLYAFQNFKSFKNS